ncbi:MAG: class I SAM-dependent methyltransferase, partial [Angustibacter sp.]
MEGTEVRKLAQLEDRHWWYRERRELLARQLRGVRPGRALDVGAAGGGNTRVLRGLGWQAAALEYGREGAE